MGEKLIQVIDGQTITLEFVDVDPDQANAWLKLNANNRNTKKGNLSKITRAMELDEFRFVGDPVRFDNEGRLIDGQHRLIAIIRSGTNQTLLVMSGFAPEAQLYVDQGSSRLAGDQVKIAGVAERAGNDWASIARLALRWDAEDLTTNILVPSNPEIVAFCAEHQEEMGLAVTAAKAQYNFPVETLKTQADVLRFAAGLEKGAVSAYLGAIPKFADRELSRAAGSILGDEAMHWAILRNAVGEDPVPAAFVS